MSNPSTSSSESRRKGAFLTKRVGKYLVGRTIGEGTYAKVKYAQHMETGKAYALKVMTKDLLIERGMVEQVKKEIGILKKLKHPHIVNLHEVMSSKDKIFMVMELVTGGDLFDKIAIQGPFKENEGKVMFTQILAAVTYSHEHGVCHRDLKPENVLLTSEGEVKLSDFGLGAMKQEELNEQLDLMNTVCGTPNYAAPEVVRRKPYSGYAADIWSLGALLYVILAGCLPFDEDNMVTLFEKISKAEFNIPAWTSPEATELLRSMLQVNPDARPTAEDLWKFSWISNDFNRTDSFANLSDITTIDGGEVFEAVDMSQLQTTRYGRLKSIDGNKDTNLTAFDLINDFIDLSGMFEAKDDLIKRHTQFTTEASLPDVFDEIEQVVVALGSGKVEKRTKTVLRLYVKTLKGIVKVAIHVKQLLSGNKIVDVQKVTGNTAEFYKWYSDLMTALSSDIYQTVDPQSSKVHVIAKMNAFELIGRNLNLGALFETVEESSMGHVQFSTRANIKDVLMRIKEGTLELGGFVDHFDIDADHLDLVAPIGGTRGMAVTVRYFEVLPSIFVVQLTKRLGSMLDLCKFYNKLADRYLDDLMMKRKDGRIPHPRAAALTSFVSLQSLGESSISRGGTSKSSSAHTNARY